MTEIIETILSNDRTGLSKLCSENPNSLFEVSQNSGKSVLQIAKEQSPNIYLCVLKHAPENIHNKINWEELLLDYISYVSNHFMSSQWYENIEYLLWGIMFGELKSKDLIINQNQIDDFIINDLKFIVSKTNSWPLWQNKVKFLQINHWARDYFKPFCEKY